MSIEREVFPSEIYPLLDLIETASPEGAERNKDALMRWKPLREITLDTGEQYYIPLKDGTLAGQVEVLVPECVRFAEEFSLTKNDARILALAYVTRQLERATYPLQLQTPAIQHGEGLHLGKLANRLVQNRDTHGLFQVVSACLILPENPAHARDLSDQRLDLTQRAGWLLSKARAVAAIKTGVSALQWTETDSRAWATRQSTDTDQQNILAAEARMCAKLIAANALFNNISKIHDTSLIGNLLDPLAEGQKKAMTSFPNYMISRTRIDAARPPYSKDCITKQISRLATSEEPAIA